MIALLYDVHATNVAIIPQDAVPAYAHCAEILNHKSIHTENFTLAVQRVREVVDALPEEDAALLRALYLQTPPLTLRAYSEKTGIPVMTLHYRKEKLLRLLKQQI